MAYIFNVLTYDNIPYWFGAFISFGIVVIYVATSGVRGPLGVMFSSNFDVSYSLDFRYVLCAKTAWRYRKYV